MREIRPKEAGESWVKDDHPWDIRMFTYVRILPSKGDQPLMLIWSNGTIRKYFPEDEHQHIIHGRGGWERINPPVENE